MNIQQHLGQLETRIGYCLANKDFFVYPDEGGGTYNLALDSYYGLLSKAEDEVAGEAHY